MEFKHVLTKLRALKITLRKDGERFSVNYRGARAATAFSVANLEQALIVGRQMAAFGRRL